MDSYTIYLRVSALLEIIIGLVIDNKPVPPFERQDQAIINILVPQLIKLRDLKFAVPTDTIIGMFSMPNRKLVCRILAKMSKPIIPDNIFAVTIHYMDIEGQTKKPTEIAIVTSREGVIVNYFHVVIKNFERSQSERMGARICHGIPSFPGNTRRGNGTSATLHNSKLCHYIGSAR